jgi:hypothetical protein
MSNGRNDKGRYANGNQGGPGRPPLAREKDYLRVTVGGCSVDDWGAIVQRAVKDAKQGDPRARDWLSRHLIGDRNSSICSQFESLLDLDFD